MDLRYGAASVSRHGNYEQMTYREFSTQEIRTGKCLCGKRVRRSRTFTQTVSPFNKDPETGDPKTLSQVIESLRAEASAWLPDYTCSTHEWACLTLRTVGGSGEGYETVFTLGSRRSRHAAQTEGARLNGGTDDFRLVLLEGNRLVGMTNAYGGPFDWPPEAYIDECRLVAERCGLRYEVTA